MALVDEEQDKKWREELQSYRKVGGKTIGKKVIKFFELYGGAEFALDGKKCAESAGFAFASVVAHRLKTKYPTVAAMKEDMWRERNSVKPDELMMHLAEVVRDKEHRDRMKAIELNARIHGMLSDKLQITMDKESLMRAIDTRLAQLAEARRSDTRVLVVNTEAKDNDNLDNTR